MNASSSALIAAVVSAIAWGFTGILVKILPPVSSLTLTYHRLLIALLVSLPIIVFLQRKNLEKFSSLKNPATWVLATLLIGYYILATTAFQLAPVGEVALLLSISPLFVLLFKIISGVKNQKHEYLGAAMALSGVLFILLPEISLGASSSESHLIGNTFSIFAAILTAAYATLFRSLDLRKKAPDTLNVSLITFALGSLILIGYREPSIINQSSMIEVATINWKYVILYLLLGVFCTAIPTIGFAIASKKLPPLVTATTSLLVPVFAGIFAYFILGEKLSSTIIPGSFLILVGLGTMLRKKL